MVLNTVPCRTQFEFLPKIANIFEGKGLNGVVVTGDKLIAGVMELIRIREKA
jgi:hypothetical protein